MKKTYFLCFLALCAWVTNAFSLDQNEKLWLAINAQKTLSPDKKWLGFIYTQLRLINRSHPLQSGLIEGGVGYHLFKDHSIWLGYRFTGHNPYNDFFQENRLFQQYIWISKSFGIHRFIARTRLEEIALSNQNQIALRLRQRFGWEIQKSFWFTNLFPFLWDEIFIPINKTNFTSNKLVSENRVFIGCNVYQSKKTWWEIGYINQYIVHTALFPQNQMNHIATVTYSFW